MFGISNKTLFQTVAAGAVWGTIFAVVTTSDIDLTRDYNATWSHERNNAIHRGINRAKVTPITKDQMLPADPFAYQL